jgi:hypothetical protein
LLLPLHFHISKQAHIWTWLLKNDWPCHRKKLIMYEALTLTQTKIHQYH